MPKISPSTECPYYTTLRVFQDALNDNIQNIEDKNIKFFSIKLMTIIGHLWKKFGKLDESDLIKNEARIKTPRIQPTSIFNMFEPLTDGQE